MLQERKMKKRSLKSRSKRSPKRRNRESRSKSLTRRRRRLRSGSILSSLRNVVNRFSTNNVSGSKEQVKVKKNDEVSFDDILYLVHFTNINPFYWTSIKASGFDLGQFPGAYFTLVTKYNVNTEKYFPGRFGIYVSKEILKQKNFHVNIRDYNGFISERNTFFYWNLLDSVRTIKNVHEGTSSEEFSSERSNEVVFHDDVSIDFFTKITMDGKTVKVFENSKHADYTKLPFYVFPFEDQYSGGDPMKRSSYDFFQKMGRLANLIPVPRLTGDILDILESGRAEYLWKNRIEQNFAALL